jgi:WXG100 family type VII secretion target
MAEVQDGGANAPIQVDGPTLRRMLTSYEVAQGECRQIRHSVGNAVSMLTAYWSGGAAQVYNDGMADWISAFERVAQALNLLDESMNSFERATGITEEDALASAGNWAGVLGGTLYTDGGMPSNQLLTDGPDSVMNPEGTQFGMEPRRMRAAAAVTRSSRLPTSFGPPPARLETPRTEPSYQLAAEETTPVVYHLARTAGTAETPRTECT